MQGIQSATRIIEPEFAIDSKLEQTAPARHVETTGGPAIKSAAAATGCFLLHFLEMGIAMGVGMAIFGPVKGALVDQGYTALLDKTSLEYQFWMNLFMVAPMVLWMRTRGHLWRHGVEMGGAMIIPTACIILLCRAGLTDVLPWFTTSLSGIAMFGGMLGYMLYRRDMYTSGYSFRWHRTRRRYA
jgi:hypothetical protein